MKANITLRHESSEDNYKKLIQGIVTDNRITYKEDEYIVTLNLVNDGIVLTKSSKDYKITINFKEGIKTKAIYDSNEFGKTLELNIETFKLEVDGNQIFIHYLVEDVNEIKYKLKYEVEE